MKFKYTGPGKDITLRGVTFKRGIAKNVKDESLAAKVARLDYFEEVRRWAAEIGVKASGDSE